MSNTLKNAAIISIGAATLGAGTESCTKIKEVPVHDTTTNTIHVHDTTSWGVIGNDTLYQSSGGDSSWVIGKSKYCLARNYAIALGNHNNTADLDLMSHYDVVTVDPSWYPNLNMRPCINAEVQFGAVLQGSANPLEAAFAQQLDTIEAATHNAYLKDANNNIIISPSGRALLNLQTASVKAAHDTFIANYINAAPKGATITGVNEYVAQNPGAKTIVQQSINHIHGLNTTGHHEIYDVNPFSFNADVMGTVFGVTPRVRLTVYSNSTAIQSNYQNQKLALSQIALAHMPGTATITNPKRPVFDEVIYTQGGLTVPDITSTATDFVNPSWDYVKGPTGRLIVGSTNLFVVDGSSPNALTDTSAMHINNDPALGNGQFKNGESPFLDPNAPAETLEMHDGTPPLPGLEDVKVIGNSRVVQPNTLQLTSEHFRK